MRHFRAKSHLDTLTHHVQAPTTKYSTDVTMTCGSLSSWAFYWLCPTTWYILRITTYLNSEYAIQLPFPNRPAPTRSVSPTSAEWSCWTWTKGGGGGGDRNGAGADDVNHNFDGSIRGDGKKRRIKYAAGKALVFFLQKNIYFRGRQPTKFHMLSGGMLFCSPLYAINYALKSTEGPIFTVRRPEAWIWMQEEIKFRKYKKMRRKGIRSAKWSENIFIMKFLKHKERHHEKNNKHKKAGHPHALLGGSCQIWTRR